MQHYDKNYFLSEIYLINFQNFKPYSIFPPTFLSMIRRLQIRKQNKSNWQAQLTSTFSRSYLGQTNSLSFPRLETNLPNFLTLPWSSVRENNFLGLFLFQEWTRSPPPPPASKGCVFQTSALSTCFLKKGVFFVSHFRDSQGFHATKTLEAFIQNAI